jgi:hypothetical protein
MSWAALNDNKQTRKLLAELERVPKGSEEFAPKVAELRKASSRVSVTNGKSCSQQS